MRLARDASAAGSLGGPGGGLACDRKWGRDAAPGEWREEELGDRDTGAQSGQAGGTLSSGDQDR